MRTRLDKPNRQRRNLRQVLMIGHKPLLASMVAIAAGLLGSSGCIVAQKSGNGMVLDMTEPTTGGTYWLYLPQDYVAASRNGKLTHREWPLVVTFHGMKPFDNSKSQIKEWQQEADRYGYVVIAPQLVSPSLLKQFPLRTVHPGVIRDEKLTIAAMDDVARRVDVDPTKVLSTSWSSGGYLAHYMANRHPERFSCISPRQSNFSAAVLDPTMVPAYRDVKVGIFYAENDFAICRHESQEAAVWYNRHGFDVKLAEFENLGHERRPGASAAFFAASCGATAKTPPTEIAHMQARSIPGLAGNETRLASAAGEPPRQEPIADSSPPVHAEAPDQSQFTAPPRTQPDHQPQLPPEIEARIAQQRRELLRSGSSARGDFSTLASIQSASQPEEHIESPRPTIAVPPDAKPVQPLATGNSLAPVPSAPASPPQPLRVRVSSTVGLAPLRVNFSALVPGTLRRGSYFLWTDNGEPVSNGINGQKILRTPGEHKIAVLMTTADGRQYEANRTVTVMEPAGTHWYHR